MLKETILEVYLTFQDTVSLRFVQDRLALSRT